MTPLVLASRSRIRADLLRDAGYTVDIDPADVNERGLEAPLAARGLGPDGIAEGLAAAKALAVSSRRPGDLVVGADQTLALGAERFSKVADRLSARRQLERLRGATHALHSGFGLARGGVLLASGVATARMRMRDVDDAELEAYLDRVGDTILGSVGCYQLEGFGVRLFESIEGDYFTVLGLPLLPLLAALRAEGAT